MRFPKKAIPALLVISLLAAIVSTLPAVAQDSFNIKIFPAKTELQANPGSTFEFYINVHNLGAQQENLKIYLMDYSINEDNEFVYEEPGHYSYSCSSWISSDANEISVPPGVIYRTRFVMNVPADVEPGGHYGVIFFEQAPVQGSSPVQATPRIGALVLATVPGEIIREGVIESVKVTSTWFWPAKDLRILPQKNIRARIVFYNKGNVHLTVRGRLTYSPTFGWDSGTIPFEEITVLPETRRYMEAVLPSPPWIGSYEARAEVEYGPSLTVFDTTKTKKTTFNIYPISILVMLLLLVTLIVVPYLVWRRGRKRHDLCIPPSLSDSEKSMRGGGEEAKSTDGLTAEEAESAAGLTAEEAESAAGLINVNKADALELQELPGIGQAHADAIIKFRNEKGAFSSIEEFGKVKGIGPKTLQRIKELITFME